MSSALLDSRHPSVDARDEPRPPRRIVVRAEALAWLDRTPAEPATAVVTSLPDVSELPRLDLDGWRTWFVGAARRLVQWIPDDGVAIFFQSDTRRGGAWIDKGYLVARAAEEERAHLVFHKIVCREPPDRPSLGRPTYSHLICVSRTVRPRVRRASPDVIASAGAMSWSKATGVAACRLACDYLVAETSTRTVVDPFCGRGTVLAVANEAGLDAIGVDLSERCCKRARRLVAPPRQPEPSDALR